MSKIQILSKKHSQELMDFQNSPNTFEDFVAFLETHNVNPKTILSSVDQPPFWFEKMLFAFGEKGISYWEQLKIPSVEPKHYYCFVLQKRNDVSEILKAWKKLESLGYTATDAVDEKQQNIWRSLLDLRASWKKQFLNHDLFDFLLQKTNMNFVDGNGNTALHLLLDRWYFSGKTHDDMQELTNEIDNLNNTNPFFSGMTGSVFRKLLVAGIGKFEGNENKKDNETKLFEKFSFLMIKNGASLTCKNNNGQTPLDLALNFNPASAQTTPLGMSIIASVTNPTTEDEAKAKLSPERQKFVSSLEEASTQLNKQKKPKI